MSGMDGAKASARRNAASKISYQCPCGKIVKGNGKAHQRSCRKHLAEVGWPLDQGMQNALREADVSVSAVERLLGAEAINYNYPQYLSWPVFKELVWRLADQSKAAL